MTEQSLFQKIIHLFIHPFGKTLRTINPRAYELLRWQITQLMWIRRIMGAPMYQQLMLPFAVRKGDTVFDVGANTGKLTLPLARLVGANGTVHAFEPVSRNFSILQKNVMDANLSSRVILNKLALGDSNQSINITIPCERLTEATLVPHRSMDWIDYVSSESGKYTAENCKIITLDNYVKENHINNISFIKCDVEGAELLVFKGAKNALRSSNPPVIMMEVFDDWTKDFGYHPKDLFEFLKMEAGYEFYWICEDGLKRVEPDDKIIPGIFSQWIDYLCIIPDHRRRRINVKRYLA